MAMMALRRLLAAATPHRQGSTRASLARCCSSSRFFCSSASVDRSLPPHVVVGMSGGVDSSVAALLLHQQGYRVTGVYMKNWDTSDEMGQATCPQDKDFEDVQQVCDRIGILAQRVNLVQAYWNSVFSPCLQEYEDGLTPNPDILCNREIKFKAFLDYADQIGADYVATGHYAILKRKSDQLAEFSSEANGGRISLQATREIPELFAAHDTSKDQSYFLSNVPGKAFAKVLFPLGNLLKKDVRRIAEEADLCTATKRDSVGICFIGKRNFSDFITNYIPEQRGYFYTVEGERLPEEHRGFSCYTIGQGAKIQGQSAKWFVVGKRKTDHSILIASGTRHPALFSDTLFACADKFNWIAGAMPSELTAGKVLRCQYRVRYRQDLDTCRISLVTQQEAIEHATSLQDLTDLTRSRGKTFLRVDFDRPQRGVTCQQALVLYRPDGLCYGGGPIELAGKSYFEMRKKLPVNVCDWRR